MMAESTDNPQPNKPYQPAAWFRGVPREQTTNRSNEDERHVMDDMAESARLRLTSAPLLPDEPTPAELDEAAGWIRSWIDSQQRSIAWLAKRIGKGTATVSQSLSGNYQGDRSSIICACIDSIETFARSEETLRPPGLVEIRVVRRMMALIQQCTATQTMGAILAPSGCAKTSVLDAAAKMIPGAVLVRMLPCDRSETGFATRIARALSVRTRHRTYETVESIIEKLRGSGRLILIDEAHQLTTQALEMLRAIHDSTGVPIVLAGTDMPEDGGKGLSSKIDDSRTGAQLLSRISLRYNVLDDLHRECGGMGGGGKSKKKSANAVSHIFTAEEVMKICGGDQLRFAPDAIDLLFRLANTPYLGCLRTCQRLAMQAAQAVQGSGRKRAIKASDLVRIMRVMQGATYTRFMEAHADRMRRISHQQEASAAAVG